MFALLTLSVPLAASAAPAKPPIAAKSNIDARGVAALDRAVAYYSNKSSFAIVATQKMLLDRKTIRGSRFQISMEVPHRASLKRTALDAKGQPTGERATRLLDNNSLYLSNVGEPPMVRAVGGSQEARSVALKEVFGDAPGFTLAVVIMSLGINPASDPYVKSVRYGEVRENGKTLKSVTMVRKAPGDGTGISAEFLLSPQNYAVEKTKVQIKFGEKIADVVTEIGRPIDNWKGSQSATDAALYNWKTLAPDIPLAPPKPKTKISVDARAKAIFARAVKIYGETKGLKARWKSRDENGKTLIGSLDFDRVGRLAGAEFGQPLVVLDGKNRWSLDDIHNTNEKNIRVYARAKTEPDEVYFEMQTAPGIAGVLGTLLGEVNPLEADVLRTESESLGLSEFRAVLLPAQSFNGQVCEVVQITHVQAMNPEAENEIQKVIQQTYWFSHENGALRRFQNRLVGSGTTLNSSDWQITEQAFNPDFAPDTFKFTPPKGAVLSDE